MNEGYDIIHGIKFSPDNKIFMAYTKTGALDGFPQIHMFDSVNFRKKNHIAISDDTIESIEFSCQSNMLLVVSSCIQNGETISTVAVWDYIDGHRDIFCKSMIPIQIKQSAWNPYIEKNADEFVTISDRCFHFWRINENL
jgi:hypothetical protein